MEHSPDTRRIPRPLSQAHTDAVPRTAPFDTFLFDARLRYVKTLCAANSLSLEKKTVAALAARYKNLKELHGVVKKIAVFQERFGLSPSHADCGKLFAAHDVLPGGPVTAKAIIAATAERFSLTPDEIAGAGRKPRTVLARRLAMYLCRELLDDSLSSIGRAFGKKHTAVLYTLKKMKEDTDSDKDRHTMLTQIRQKLFFSP